jgi:hypothetical protein
MAEFRRSPVSPPSRLGRETRLKVHVKTPLTTHELSVVKLTAWLEGAGSGGAGGQEPAESHPLGRHEAEFGGRLPSIGGIRAACNKE